MRRGKGEEPEQQLLPLVGKKQSIQWVCLWIGGLTLIVEYINQELRVGAGLLSREHEEGLKRSKAEKGRCEGSEAGASKLLL